VAVVGRRGDTTIEALLAEGTNRHGRIVLRIIVDPSNGPATTRCYEYAVDWSGGRTGDPKQMSDCSGPALALQPPVEVDVVSQSATEHLLRVLAGIAPSERRDQPPIRQKVTELFGPPAIVAVGATNSGDLEVTIRAGDQCAFALLPESSKPTLIGTGQGLQCEG
jgi:hypothetical protein